MVKINVKQINETFGDGHLCCKERTTNDIIKIQLLTLQEDGVHIYHDGKIEIGGPRPPIEYFTDNPPHTDEVSINITGWFYIYHTLIIEPRKDYTYIAMIDKPQNYP